MKFGLSKSEYSYVLDTVIEPLKKKGATLWIYGSRARGDHSRFSDVDIMIESSSDISKTISEIRETLSAGPFPYKVDLVDYREFAESYKPQYLIDRKPYG